jgi:hypothetical protein
LLLILIAPHRVADYLVADHAALAFSAYERGCLTKLAAVLRDITPVAPRAEWEEDESESVAALREVAILVSFHPPLPSSACLVSQS